MTLFLALALLGATQTPPARPAAKTPAIVGAWTLNKELTATPQTPPGEAQSDRRGGGNGGGYGGGYGRGGGRRRGGGGGGGDTSSAADREKAQRIRDAIRDELTVADRLTIVQTESGTVVLTSGDGHVTRLSPDGSKIKDENTNVERRTKWDGGKLVCEVTGLGTGKITETYAMSADQHLVITIAVEGSRSQGAFEQKRVYDATPQ